MNGGIGGYPDGGSLCMAENKSLAGQWPYQKHGTKRKSYSVFIIDPLLEGIDRFRSTLAGCSHFVSYCTSAREAEAIMAGVTADIVLCRLTSPCIKAYEILESVQRKNPHCIRLIYSREEEKANLMQAVTSGFAHRFFFDPSQPSGLPQMIDSILSLRSRLDMQDCWKFLERSTRIPALPSVIREMEAILADPGYQMKDLVAVLEKDPILASRLLQIVNSAAFFKAGSIGSLERAVLYLGSKLVREIILFICAMEIFPQPEKCRYKAVRVSMHSLQCAKLAKEVARTIAPGQEDEAGAAALLHDIGKLVYFSSFCPRYLDSLSMDQAFDISATEFEEQIFGISHAKLGGSLLLWWNMPLSLVETAANHNMPLADLRGVPRCVAIADRCLFEASREGQVKTDIGTLPAGYPLAQWREWARKLVGTMA